MRINILFLSFLISLSAKSQESDTKQIDFRISCGYAGMTSPEVKSIQHLTTKPNYIILKKKLFGNNNSEAILSAISLSELQSKKYLVLGTDDQNRIDEIKKWNIKYSLCYTCTGHYSGTVRELLQNTRNESYSIILRALFDSE